MSRHSTHTDNSFDLIRFLAALAVLFSHSFPTSGLAEPKYFAGESAGSLGVFVFFAISGYLVQQSWDRRPDARSFILSRALRIFPGLCVCLFLSAFILGPIVSSLVLTDYFFNLETYKYIYSNLMMFFVQRYDSLPGVFTDNIFPKNVNSSLWTIRYEIFMYLALLLFSVLFNKKRMAILVVVLVSLCALWVYGKWIGLVDPGQLLWRLDVIGLDGRILKLAPFFMVGALVTRIPVNFLSTKVAVCVALVTSIFYSSPNAIVILWFTLPYCLVVLAYKSPKKLNKFGKHGDFSYGLYMYAFPVQQVMALLAISTTSWVFGFTITFFVTLGLAMLSWQFVESPALRLRKKLNSSDTVANVSTC